MKQSISAPVAATIIVVAALIIGVFLWHNYMTPPAVRVGAASSSRAVPADMQKNPNPQDLAKQYGYSR